MDLLLGQAGTLSETQQAVREQFQHGGSVGAVILVAFGLLFVVVATHGLTQLLKKNRGARRDDPERLFHDVLRKMRVPEPQRRLLDALAREVRLAQPATMLVSEAVFERCVRRWRAMERRTPRDAELVDQTRMVLFPKSTSPRR